MLKWLNNKKKDNKGFSLVELIIVVAIMAILVGLLAPQYLKYVEKSRKSADASNLDQMVQAVQVYAADSETTLAAGTYHINIKKDKTYVDDGIKAALEESVPGYGSIKLKSNKWEGMTDADGLGATITVDAEGGTTVSYTPQSLATYVNKNQTKSGN